MVVLLVFGGPICLVYFESRKTNQPLWLFRTTYGFLLVGSLADFWGSYFGLLVFLLWNRLDNLEG